MVDEANTSSGSAPELSNEERLAFRLAVDRGMLRFLEKLLQQTAGYQELLEEDVSEDASSREYVRRSQRALLSGKKWLDILSESLERTKVESVDITLLLNGAVKRCQQILRNEENADLTLTQECEEVVVRGNMFQLQELLVTLLLTASRNLFRNTRDPVEVKAEINSLSEDFFSLMKSQCKAGDYFCITVSPATAGVDVERQIPFVDNFALPHDEDDADKSFLRSLVEMYGILLEHGGDATVQTEDRQVTSMTMLIPVEAKRRDMHAPHNISDENLYGNETILLVDDEDTIWDVIIDMLQELGYEVILAANGQEAVEIYRDNPHQIDVVLLDMVMPEMDGHTAYFKLTEVDPDVKVLLSSAYVSEDDVRDVLEAGADGFLQKPYRMEELARRIREVLAA